MMNIAISVEINTPIKDVWHDMAIDFPNIANWYSPVVKSYELPHTPRLSGAPCSGRVCEFTQDEMGLKAAERITQYDEENKRLEVEVDIINSHSIAMIRGNHASFQLSEISPARTLLIFRAKPELKLLGRVLSPLLQMTLCSQFMDMLHAFKQYSEGLKRAF
ncbi:MAG: SRPBCC family protein [Marinomonas sp.]